MSIENALTAFSEAANNLAAAMNAYAGVMDKYGAKVIAANEGEAAAPAPAAEPEKKKGGRPAGSTNKKAPDPEPTPAADDGFGDDDGEAAEEAISHEDVQAKLMEVKNVNNDKTPAIAIIKKYSYNAIAEIAEKDRAAIIKDCNTWLKKNG